MTETWQKTHIPVMRNSLNLLLNWSHNSRQPHRISPNLEKGLREVKKSKIIHLVKSTVPSPMQPGLRAAKVADMGSIWGSPCCDLFICMVIVLWTSAKSPSSGKSMHLMCAFAKAAPALSTSSEIILFRFALLDNNQR